jgi:hypothetical protein
VPPSKECRSACWLWRALSNSATSITCPRRRLVNVIEWMW